MVEDAAIRAKPIIKLQIDELVKSNNPAIADRNKLNEMSFSALNLSASNPLGMESNSWIPLGTDTSKLN